jgi:hypothetical protein
VVPGAGTVVGYRSAKVVCEAACTASAAHMCTSEEIVRSAQLGLIPPSATRVRNWIATGVFSYYSPNPTPSRDCLGWTDGSSTELGSMVNVDSNGPGGGQRIWVDVEYCDRTARLACCL